MRFWREREIVERDRERERERERDREREDIDALQHWSRLRTYK